MTVLHECYQSGDDLVMTVYSTIWTAVVFTVGTVGVDEDHNITSVKIKCYRTGLPGTIDVSIRACDGAGKPTGSDLSTGSFNGDVVTDSSPGALKEVTMTSYTLAAGTQYAIVIAVPSGDSSNKLNVRYDNNDGAYTGGDRHNSNDSGSTWSIGTNDDYIFEVYGDAVVVGAEESMSFGVRRRTMV